MRSFVIVGRTAHADGRVRLDDLPGTSGRLDVLVRCVRAALCISHGIRRDARVYLVLSGGDAPRAVRIDGATAKFLRPDERSLATTLLKAIARASADGAGAGFVPQRLGFGVASAGLEAVLADVAGEPLYVLEEGAADVREARPTRGVFVIGDHTGFDPAVRSRLASASARPISVGPVSLHSDDVVTLVNGEVDRALPG